MEDLDHGPDDLGAQFTEILIKKNENVGLLLSLLEVRLNHGFLKKEVDVYFLSISN